MKPARYIVPILTALLLAIGVLAPVYRAEAGSRCLYGSCASGSKERLFGPSPDTRDVTKRGYRSWNDMYNQRKQERYKSGIKAKPFDFGSSVDPSRPLARTKPGTFNDDHPEARSEHVRWCLKRYRSYAVRSNTYVTYEGRTRFCDSPFN